MHSISVSSFCLPIILSVLINDVQFCFSNLVEDILGGDTFSCDYDYDLISTHDTVRWKENLETSW